MAPVPNHAHVIFPKSLVSCTASTFFGFAKMRVSALLKLVAPIVHFVQNLYYVSSLFFRSSNIGHC